MTSDYLQFVLDQLAGLGCLRERRMFGGAGIYCDEIFFAIVYQDTLYLKVDNAHRAVFVQAGSTPFKPLPIDPRLYNITRSPLTGWKIRACCGSGHVLR